MSDQQEPLVDQEKEQQELDAGNGNEQEVGQEDVNAEDVEGTDDLEAEDHALVVDDAGDMMGVQKSQDIMKQTVEYTKTYYCLTFSAIVCSVLTLPNPFIQSLLF